MIFLGELRVEGTIGGSRTVSHFIQRIGRRLRLTEGILYGIDLAVEEAAVNIVRYAYPAGAVGEMLVQAEIIDDVLRITLTDWCIPLNPDNVKPFETSAPVETRIRGGLRLHLVNCLGMASCARRPRTLAARTGQPWSNVFRFHRDQGSAGRVGCCQRCIVRGGINDDIANLALCHSGTNGQPRAYLCIEPVQGLAVAIAALNRSEDGAHDLEVPPIQLVDFLEYEAHNHPFVGSS